MENYQYIIYTVSFILIASLSLFLFIKFKESDKLKSQLKKINGLSDEDFFSRRKFTELGFISAGITHEISSPLTVILERLTTLSRMDLTDKNKPKFKKGLDQIKSNVERISSIIKSFKEYIYRNNEETEEYISLTEILNKVLIFFSQRLKNHGIELRLKNIENVYVSGHRDQFEEALLNLISNSFDAIDKVEEKWIEISTEKTSDNVRIFVRDSGPRIPSEIRGKMLDLFYTTKTNTGSGLGLPLVKEIAQRHGGDFKYIEGEHTTFMLELPKANSAQYHH